MPAKNNNETWIADDDKSIRWVLEKALQKAKIAHRSFASANDLLDALQHETPLALLSDIRMEGIDGLQLLGKMRQSHPDLPIIIMTAHSDLDTAVSAFSTGAFEYIAKPFAIKEVVAVVRRACVQNTQGKQTTAEIDKTTPEIIGAAPAMQEVFRAIGRLARSNVVVLINGESGTGKELVAKALHRHSPRSKQPFIALNMAAIPKDLMESELFGHEKGAFTGAYNRRIGRFEQADGGTLFLDEIGDMPPVLQTSLLRVLADNEFYPVGAHASIKVNVRIIAATHQNMESLVAQGLFREDLFYRLNVIRIAIPPLRDRREDIAVLLRHFLQVAAVELDTEAKILQSASESYLTTLPWPGNVRQLENICRWLTVMAPGREIHLEDLPSELSSCQSTLANSWQSMLAASVQNNLVQNQPQEIRNITPEVEKILITQTLQHTEGKISQAALLLGYSRNILSRKIKELAIDTNQPLP